MIMQNLRHNLDPEGDTILVLRCPNTQKLVWEPKDAGNKWKRRNYTLRAKLFGSRLMSDMESDHFEDGDTHERSPEPIATTIESSVSSHEVEFRLSSRHLTLASPVFKKMMSGSWKESAPSSDGQVRYELTATEWDANDFLLLMRVIHGRNIQVPLSIDLETLGRISVLVDYYQCEEVTRLAVGLWIDKVGELPTSYGPECVIWMFVSWVFSYSEIFEKMTELAMKGSEGGLGTIYLPFPPTLLTGLEQKRDHFLDEMFNTLGGVCEDLCMGRRGCNIECSSMLLGSLMKGMYRLKRYGECSAEQAKSAVLLLHSVKLSHDTYCSHLCNLRNLFEPDIERLWCGLDGLKLDHHNDQGKKFADAPSPTLQD